MKRVLIVAAFGCAKPAQVPQGSSQAELAAIANREGEQLLADGNHAEAARRFIEAVSRASDPLYYLNLCRALHGKGLKDDSEDALVACNEAIAKAPNPVFAHQATKLKQQVEREARDRPSPVASGDPPKPHADVDPPHDTPTSEPPRGSRVPPPIPSRNRSSSGSSQTVIAERLNDEGNELMKQQRYGEASAKFREAVARVPEAIYFFNLCLSLFNEGKFGEALTSCSAVLKNDPSADLEVNTNHMIWRIRDEAKKQGIGL